MSGNEKSGRKKLKYESVEYRFMMPHYIDAILESEAKKIKIDKRTLLKKIAVEYFDI